MDIDRASFWVRWRCSGGVGCFGPDGTAVGLTPLSSPLQHHSGLPSRDTTTFPPSFSASVRRSWMSSRPFTCHSCLIPDKTFLELMWVNVRKTSPKHSDTQDTKTHTWAGQFWSNKSLFVYLSLKTKSTAGQDEQEAESFHWVNKTSQMKKTCLDHWFQPFPLEPPLVYKITFTPCILSIPLLPLYFYWVSISKNIFKNWFEQHKYTNVSPKNSFTSQMLLLLLHLLTLANTIWDLWVISIAIRQGALLNAVLTRNPP